MAHLDCSFLKLRDCVGPYLERIFQRRAAVQGSEVTVDEDSPTAVTFSSRPVHLGDIFLDIAVFLMNLGVTS